MQRRYAIPASARCEGQTCGCFVESEEPWLLSVRLLLTTVVVSPLRPLETSFGRRSHVKRSGNLGLRCCSPHNLVCDPRKVPNCHRFWGRAWAKKLRQAFKKVCPVTRLKELRPCLLSLSVVSRLEALVCVRSTSFSRRWR